MEEQIKQLARDYVEVVEATRKHFQEYPKKAQEIGKQIKRREQEFGDEFNYKHAEELVIDYLDSYFFNETLNKNQEIMLLRLSEIYKLSKIYSIDLGLNEELTKELDTISAGFKSIIRVEKGEVVFLEGPDTDKIKEVITSRSREHAEAAFKNIISDPSYKKLEV